jgi:hypothetical protein
MLIGFNYPNRSGIDVVYGEGALYLIKKASDYTLKVR